MTSQEHKNNYAQQPEKAQEELLEKKKETFIY